jgi:type VI secretion system protein ImpJ
MQHLPVHWHEGMFLRPQHFQAAERAWIESLQTSEQWDHEFNYGLRTIEFSAEAIANYQFQINACLARMKDGTLVTLSPGREPDRVDLRPSLAAAAPKVDFRQALEGATTVRLYLAVPKLKLGSANVAEDGEAGRHRFATDLRAVPDENTSGQDQEIQVRTLNVQLLLSTQELSGFEVLPIAQIQRAGKDQAAPQLDTNYIPPVLATDAWPQLGRDIVRAIYDVIGSNIESLSKKVMSRAITLVSQDARDMQMLWTLAALNSGYAVLGVLAFARGVHPLQAYTELCRIVGQLAIFSPTRRPPTIPKYDHDDLHGIFSYIKLQIELLLKTIPDIVYDQRPFIGEGIGMQVTLEREWFNDNWEWYIGVSRGALTEAECRGLLAGLDWKLGSKDKVDEYFKQKMRSLELFPLNQGPRPLPPLRDCSFFSVSRQGVAWDHVVRSGTLAMRLKEDLIRNRDKLQGSETILVSMGQRVAALKFTLFVVPK